MAIPYARVFVVFVNSVYAVRILYKYTNEVTISWLKSPINKNLYLFRHSLYLLFII